MVFLLPLYFLRSSAFFLQQLLMPALLMLTAVAYCLAGFGLKIVNTEEKIPVFGADGIYKSTLPNSCIHGGCWSSVDMPGREVAESRCSRQDTKLLVLWGFTALG